ncbi:MAG TPA: ABC transporter ATP-binding protein [archaeon]|nr:ABC transporter ATP-binding protein [archaeon]
MGAVKVKALDEVNIKIDAGEFVAVLGPSGSGKSTLMNLIGCLDTPTDGVYRLDGEPVQKLKKNDLAEIRNQKIGFVFQNFNLLAYATALENVELPLIYGKVSSSQRRRRAKELLELVGLGDRATHRPSELSGGQRQRVAIARSMANDPEIILADEPTGNLDSKSGAEIVELFGHLHQDGKTLIVVTHDQKVARYCKRVITLLDGKVESDQAVEKTAFSVPALV